MWRRIACALAVLALAACHDRQPDQQHSGQPPTGAVQEAAGSPRPTNPRTPAPPVMPPLPSHPTSKIVDGTRVATGALMGVIGLTRPGDWSISISSTFCARPSGVS